MKSKNNIVMSVSSLDGARERYEAALRGETVPKPNKIDRIEYDISTELLDDFAKMLLPIIKKHTKQA